MEAIPDFNEHMVLLSIEAPDKWALLERMVEVLSSAPTMLLPDAPGREQVLAAVLEREHDKATGLGHGFAFPHARIAGLSNPIMAVATLTTPLDFDAMDDEPAEVVALLVVPDEHPQVALKVMSQFARLVSDPLEYEVLRSLHEPRLFAAFVARQVLGASGPIMARDIMRTPYINVHPNTPLREVTRLMMQYRLDAVAVVEEDRTLVGEITTESIFQLGLPDFFGQLKSVSFISAFDPFEKYFEGEGGLLARDVMTRDYAAMPETATLLEIVFELAVKRRAKVHVVRDGKRIGAIDRAVVLDRVINI